MRAAQRSAAATGLADVGASDSGGGGKNFLDGARRGDPTSFEPGYATPFRGRGARQDAAAARPTGERRREKSKEKREQQKGARGWRSQRFRQPDVGNGALPSRRLKLSQGGDARGIDFVIASGGGSGSAHSLLLSWDSALKGWLEPAGARWGCRAGC